MDSAMLPRIETPREAAGVPRCRRHQALTIGADIMSRHGLRPFDERSGSGADRVFRQHRTVGTARSAADLGEDDLASE